MGKRRSSQRQKRQLSLEEWRRAALDESLIFYVLAPVVASVVAGAIALFWAF